MITINGLNITDNINYLVEELEYKTMPARNLVYEPISTRPGDKMIACEWGQKEIYFKGRVFGSTPAELQTNVDTLQMNFAVPFVSISIDDGRTYTGTLSEMSVPTQFYTLSMLEYEARFVCVDPFAYGSAVSVSGTVVSGTTTFSGTVTISGTQFAEPTLTIIPAGGSSGDSGIRQMRVYHTPTGEIVTVSGTYNYLTNMVIDYQNFFVTKDGLQVDYQGIFSRFEPGSVSFEITVISGVKQGYDWVLSYQPRYFQ